MGKSDEEAASRSNIFKWIDQWMRLAHNSEVAGIKINAYVRVKKVITDSKKTWFTPDDIRKLELTDHMQNKIIASMFQAAPLTPGSDSGRSKLIESLLQTPGIGNALANKLIDAGLTRTADLRSLKFWNMLPEATRVCLTYKPMRRIPREAIIEFQSAVRELIPRIEFCIAGSFRRGRPDSGDIDLLIKYTSGLVFEKLAPLNIVFHSRGPEKAAGVVRIGEYGYAQIDIMIAKPADYPTFLLYLTGSREFNIRMRAHAKKLGYMLNQHGLYKNGLPVYIKSEVDVFRVLQLAFVSPVDRN